MAVVSVIAMIACPFLFLVLRLFWSPRPVKAYAVCMNFSELFSPSLVPPVAELPQPRGL